MPQRNEPTKEINPNVHKRILRFLNTARRPEDLAHLPSNKIETLTDPEHRLKRPYRHEPLEEPRTKLCRMGTAKEIFKVRHQQHPLGFGHIEQLRPILKAKEFQRIIDILIEWFSGRTYGSWSDPIDLADEDGHLSVVHAAVVNTGEVLMIEHACHSGISKTPLWNPENRTLNPAPTPPSEGLYCSGHCFLSDGKLLVVGGRGDANDWPADKDIAWLYDPAAKTWDVTRDKTVGGSPRRVPRCTSTAGIRHW